MQIKFETTKARNIRSGRHYAVQTKHVLITFGHSHNQTDRYTMQYTQ